MYEYGEVPPVAATVTDPSPVHTIFVWDDIFKVNASVGCITVALFEVEQPLASVITTE